MRNILKALGAYALVTSIVGTPIIVGAYRTNQAEESQKSRGLERNLTEDERNFTTQSELPGNVFLENTAKRIERGRERGTKNPQHIYNTAVTVETPIEIKNSPKDSPDYDNLIEQIKQIESSGNPNAYNKRTKATGLMQVTPIVLKEFNKLNPGKRYSLKDMKNPEKSVEVGEWYLRERIEKHYFEKENIAPTNKNLAGAYNAGPNRLRDYLKRGVPLPRETTIYMDKIN